MNSQPWIHTALVISMGLFATSACAPDRARDKLLADVAADPARILSEEAGIPNGSSIGGGSGSSAASEFGAPPSPTQDYLLDAETATSKTTGLMWLRATIDTRYTGGSCIKRCTDLTAAGRDDWRAPTMEELKGILVSRPSCPLIDEDAFPLSLCTWYTSSDIKDGNPSEYLMLSFYSGEVKSRAEAYPSTGFPCRCVR